MWVTYHVQCRILYITSLSSPNLFLLFFSILLNDSLISQSPRPETWESPWSPSASFPQQNGCEAWAPNFMIALTSDTWAFPQTLPCSASYIISSPHIHKSLLNHAPKSSNRPCPMAHHLHKSEKGIFLKGILMHRSILLRNNSSMIFHETPDH